MREETVEFRAYLTANGLRWSTEREIILDEFLKNEGHMTLEDIYKVSKKRSPRINSSTVYRNMELLKKSGIAEGWKGEDKKSYYEHKWKHKHHDHMICSKCSTIVEFHSERLEKVQAAVSREYGFDLTGHKMFLFGVCRNCR